MSVVVAGSFTGGFGAKDCPLGFDGAACTYGIRNVRTKAISKFEQIKKAKKYMSPERGEQPQKICPCR